MGCGNASGKTWNGEGEYMRHHSFRNDNRVGLVQENDRSFFFCASRRKFLKSLALTGAVAIMPGRELLAQNTSAVAGATPGRIDVHHHMFPPFYVKAMEDELRASGFTDRHWTPAVSIDIMDKHGIATAMLSPVQRLVMDSMSDRSERARSLARQNNEYGAQLVKDHPGRFGHFAALPLPDQDGSLREIEYALDVLKADGIALWTSYMDKWPGDPAFAGTFEELNRRNAVVFFHPARASCCRNLVGQSGIIEYDIDTARAIDSLLLNGTFARFPNIRFIFSHSGGAFSVLAARISDDFPKSRADRAPKGVDYEVKKLYFDVAHAGKPPALDALKDIVPISQILYGSDAPLRTYELTDDGLKEYGGFSKNDWKAINRGNAERLFPRLQA
jgi:predicted TIM-barrel fold metal-dependent hydrolase